MNKKEQTDSKLKSVIQEVWLNDLSRQLDWFRLLVEDTASEAQSIKEIHSPRELQIAFTEIARDAKRIRLAVDEEVVFDLSLEEQHTPDTWTKIRLMLQAIKEQQYLGLHIEKPPHGTPDDIANAWVGLTLPFSLASFPSLVFSTPQLEARNLLKAGQQGYLFWSRPTIEFFAHHQPAAARAYKAFRPNWDENDRRILFTQDSGRMVEIKNVKTAA